VGIAGGRWLWARFARDIGVDPAASVPALLLLGAVAVVLVVGTVSSLAPGVLAGATRPAEAMRAD
jgi:hypothetical protein